jgi:hypothetical protein
MCGIGNIFKRFKHSQQDKTTIPTINEKEYNKLRSQIIAHSDTIVFLGVEELEILSLIREETRSLNLNNITRTMAYLDFYLENKEIHWSFLAHMVSRNGGWNMTDLKGSLLSQLLPENKVQIFFEFLEKANAMIFYDAYAQLLLYRYSKEVGKNLFYLLPHLSVSTFMKPIWDYFWKTNHSSLLTVALIINEQYYIQSRLIENGIYKKEVLDTLLFQTQENLGFTDVLFPYKGNHHQIELAGVTVQNFEDVNARINMGKTLYGILFHKIFTSASTFAIGTPHTGTRADYWPDIFTNNMLKIEGGKHRPYIFSPTLKQAWPTYQHEFVDQADWYSSPDVIHLLRNYYIPASYKLTKNYKKDISNLVFMKDIKSIVS